MSITFDQLVADAVIAGASDLHLTVGHAPALREHLPDEHDRVRQPFCRRLQEEPADARVVMMIPRRPAAYFTSSRTGKACM